MALSAKDVALLVQEAVKAALLQTGAAQNVDEAEVRTLDSLNKRITMFSYDLEPLSCGTQGMGEFSRKMQVTWMILLRSDS